MLNLLSNIKDFATEAINNSYYICLIGAIIGAILYMCGHQRSKGTPLIMLAIYIIIQILGGCLV